MVLLLSFVRPGVPSPSRASAVIILNHSLAWKNESHKKSEVTRLEVKDKFSEVPLMSLDDRAVGGRDVLYTVADCALGSVLLARSKQGVVALYLGDSDAVLEQALRQAHPGAERTVTDRVLNGWLKEVHSNLSGERPILDLPLDVMGTAFQRRVWQELRAIPPGRTRSYGEIARRLGQPTAARAVARACAANPVSLVIPCHRVVQGDGGLGGYSSGLNRKRALLALEQARAGRGSG
jgi:AraC family transcriptional regulator of adaptative response/methylated-DNA-[protein]-cysteine methyltransferase